jgi:hypothetical protein
VLAIMNDAAINVGVQESFGHTDFISFDIHQVRRLMEHMVFPFLNIFSSFSTVLHNGYTNLH